MVAPEEQSETTETPAEVEGFTHRPSLLVRLAARLVDFVIVFGVSALVLVPLLTSTRFGWLVQWLIVGSVVAAVAFVYEVPMIGRFSATVGKFAFGLRVVDERGDPVGMDGARNRWEVFYLPMIVPLLGVVWAVLVCASPLFDSGQQGWHDRAASTLVVARRGKRPAAYLVQAPGALARPAWSAGLRLAPATDGGGGLRVLSVRHRSPADVLGLQRGDVLLSANGRALSEPQELAVAVAALEDGAGLPIRWRSGGEVRSDTLGPPITQELVETGRRVRIGAEVRTAMRDGLMGAEVTSVVPGEAAWRAGLAEGDLVVAVDDHRVRGRRTLVDVLADAPDDVTAGVRVLRKGQLRELVIDLVDDPIAPAPRTPSGDSEQLSTS